MLAVTDSTCKKRPCLDSAGVCMCGRLTANRDESFCSLNCKPYYLSIKCFEPGCILLVEKRGAYCRYHDKTVMCKLCELVRVSEVGHVCQECRDHKCAACSAPTAARDSKSKTILCKDCASLPKKFRCTSKGCIRKVVKKGLRCHVHLLL